MQGLERIGHRRSQVGDPDGTDVPPGPDHRDGIGKQLRAAHHFEGVVDATGAGLLHGGDGIEVVAFGQDEVGGTELDSHPLLGRHPVDGDDLGRSAQPGRLDDVQPDPARTDDHHRVAQLHACTVEHGTGTGHDRASDEGCRT